MAKPVVLVVDDDEAIGKLLRMVAELWGGDVYVATNGLEALAHARNITPDLIILDIMMHGIDGLQLCRMFREREETKDTYILIISARADMETVGDALNAGASDFWSKPIARDWMQKLRKLIQEKIEEKANESRNNSRSG